MTLTGLNTLLRLKLNEHPSNFELLSYFFYRQFPLKENAFYYIKVQKKSCDSLQRNIASGMGLVISLCESDILTLLSTHVFNDNSCGGFIG